MSSNQPITNGIKTMLTSAADSARHGTRVAKSAVLGARHNIDDFRENNEFYNDTSSRQALIEGIKKIQKFPAIAANMLAQSHVQHSLHHVGRLTPKPVLIGLGGLAGAGLIAQSVQFAADKLKPKRCRSPFLYIAPALVGGMILSEHLNPLLKKIQEGQPSQPAKQDRAVQQKPEISGPPENIPQIPPQEGQGTSDKRKSPLAKSL